MCHNVIPLLSSYLSKGVCFKIFGLVGDAETSGNGSDRPNQGSKSGKPNRVSFESLVQIISAVIGSTLIVTALASLGSVINNPDIYLHIQPQITPNIENNPNVQPSPVSSYQIIARNDGRAQATNVTLSMFIRANINHWTPVLNSEDITKNSTKKYESWSVEIIHFPRFTRGAIIIFTVNVTKANIITPYFVSADYDQGSNQFPNYLPADIQQGRFPDITAGRSDPIQLVIILSLIFSALAFAVTLIGIGKLRQYIGAHLPIDKNNIVWFAPAVILSSVFLLYIFEEVPRSLLISSLILNRPADVTTGLSITTSPEGSPYNQGTLLLGAFAFCGISWFAMGLVGYLITKKIISKLFQCHSDKNGLNRYIDSWRFKWLCYFLIGMPFYSFIMLFLPKSIEGYYSASLFMIFLLFEICRFLVLTLIIPNLFLKGYVSENGRPRTDLLYYPIFVFSILIAISQFVLAISLSKTFSTDYRVLASQDLFWIVLIFCVILGAVQILIGSFIAHYFISNRNKMKNENEKNKSLIWKFEITSVLIISITWILVLYDVTSYHPAMLRAGIPVINMGVICILLGIGSMIVTFEIIFPESNLSSKSQSNKDAQASSVE